MTAELRRETDRVILTVGEVADRLAASVLELRQVVEELRSTRVEPPEGENGAHDRT